MATEITLSISDADLAELTRIGIGLGQTARRVAERMIHRALTRAERPRGATNEERAADRALRQLELAKLLRRRRLSALGRAEKQQLAAQFGVAERTLYRDLKIVARALKRPKAPARRAQQAPPEALAV